VRQLHVVAITSDGKQLLLAGAAKGARASHQVAIDKKLHAALAGELYAEALDGEEPARQESALTPREMQARLRAGESVDEVAHAAGVAVERVERYAGPVESERQQVLDAARAVVMERPRWGASARTLGDSVIANLAYISGLAPESVAWSTRRRPDGCWVLRLDFSARGRRRRAEWEWEPAERAITPIDSAATSLGYIEPRSRARARANAAATRRRSSGTRTTTSRKTAGRKTTARKSSSRKAATRKTAARKTTTRKAPTRKTAARKTAARKTTARKTTGRKAAARKSVARTSTKAGARRTTARTTTRTAAGGRRSTRRR
jgi:hypothetical protein